jgi:hypothetical protein
MVESHTWMDPDLNKYDLNHRVTHHPVMSDQEWEGAYREANRMFYTWDHMQTVLRRMVALGSNKRFTTLHRLLSYREAVRLEKVSIYEYGYFRIKRRRQRRPSLPVEVPIVFYSHYAWHILRYLGGTLITYLRLRLMLARILADPRRMDYADAAIATAKADGDLKLITDTRSTERADRRRRRGAKSVA